MRVLHLTSSRFYGGPERQMLGLAQALRPDVKTTFASFSEGGLNRSFLDEVSKSGFGSFDLRNDTPKLWSAYREVADLLRTESIDVLIVHGYKAGLLGWYAARKVRIPVMAVSRGWTGEDRKVRLYERLDRWMLKRMDKVVCVSHGQATKVVVAGVRRDRVEVIHNAVNVERFAGKDPAYRTKLEKMFPDVSPIRHVIGAAGRLSPEKGFDVLIAAAAKVCDEIGDVGFVLFGDGPLKADLERQIDTARIKNRFRLAGFTSELDRFMSNFDLFVQSSHTEGLPNVLLEAAAAGVPVVATDVGGTSEVVADGVTGALVAPADSDQLARQLTHLLEDDTTRLPMSHRGPRHIGVLFTFQTQAQSYMSTLKSIVSSQPTDLFAASPHTNDRDEATCNQVSASIERR